MDRLGLLESFVIALDEGSLNRAAQRRGISQPAMSLQIKQLEALLGHELLHRSSTGVKPTRPGQLVYTQAQGLLSGYDRMSAELSALTDSISGTFRISTSTFFGRIILGPVLLEVNQAYPDLDIVMKLEDRLVDVVRENVDLAIRSGTLGDSDGAARKIAQMETVLFATSTYLDQVGRPKEPEELKRLKFIQHHEDQTGGFVPLTLDGVEYQAPVHVGFTADDPDLIIRAVSNHTGYARAPRLFLEEALWDGRFEEILPRYQPQHKEIYAVYPSRHSYDKRHEVIISSLLDRMEALRVASIARRHPPAAIIA
ncbi:LysR family transcriptional regulator [Pseudophaeobacter flagellatus]|uniref:LysR family transcriptional regulator n=1 Tax=Pseudophaeobacter flagellatus TaxID=2899119 RepID=UPI001E4E2F03|nr:LysR family transcriptional regulator [Pseudophaeobacter flagellatus]MCD9146741.1 LysR family transcriptional regulator [Pseudophaeobacter flagellatus]